MVSVRPLQVYTRRQKRGTAMAAANKLEKEMSAKSKEDKSADDSVKQLVEPDGCVVRQLDE